MSAAKNLSMWLVVGVMLSACTSADKEPKKIIRPGKLYRYYTISGEEGRDWVTVYVQFRRNGPNGMPTVLEEPQKIFLDGQPLAADSTVEKEFFYETQAQAQEFSGEHKLVFVDQNETEHEDQFTFAPFQLNLETDKAISRDELVLALEGVEEGDKLRVVMVDTAFSSNGINEFYTVSDGKLDLRNHLDGKIKNGPITLQLFKETENALKSDPMLGKLAITYGLKREFELKD